MTDSEFAANLRVKFAQCQCLVLMADSGMGKTELLRYLALEHQKLSGTVYLLYLNILQYSEEGIGNEASLNILKSVLSDKNILLIQKALENISYDPITILLDGYNEIHKKNIKKINRLLKLLFTSKQIQIVISVRNHEKPALQSFLKECKINVLYYSLEPFSKENVIEYLAQSWKEKVEIDIDFKFYSYSKVLVEKFYNLCSVPLMVKMMSKIYKQRFEQFKETGFIEKKDETSYLKKEFLEVEHIYEIFIKKCLLVKIDDACHGIGQVDLNKQVFVEFYLDHQLLAIEFLDVDELKFVFKNPKYMKNWDCIETNNQRQLEKSILLNFVDGKVSFSHYSYAEYFVATFLWDDFIDLKNIVKNVLSCSTGIRRFFIQIIEKNIKLFVSKIVQETSFDSKDVIFWACESDAVELLKYLLSKKTLFRPKEAKMLHIAIENGSDKICSYLIDDCIAHPDAKYDGDLAPLHSAIKYGRIKLVQILLRNGADINIQNSEGWSALHYAVHRKRIDIAELLIDKGIEVNSRSKSNWNALHIACNNGDAELANMLIENGAELLMRTNEDKTALDLAASSGCTEIVITIINNLINIYPLHSMIATAYRTADWCGYHTLQEALISKFPKLAGDLDIDETPIHFAARKGLFGKVKELINDGFNVNALSKSKLTALHLSASAGHRLVIDLLLDVGANINAVDGDNVTPLYLACQNGHTVVVETLIRRGSSIDILTHNELTVLHTSASKGHCDIVNLLLLEGAKINAVDGYGATPLHLACENGHIEVVKTLVRRGANIHALTCDSLTALHVSAYEGNCSIVDLLLNYGANVNAVEIDKWTPLHLACQNGHIEVVKTLVERDANINALTANGWSALHVSAYGGHSIIVDLLLREGANIESVVKGDITLGAVYKLRRLIYGCLRTASFPK
nr:ankyrin-3-like [Aedes albopictus]